MGSRDGTHLNSERHRITPHHPQLTGNPGGESRAHPSQSEQTFDATSGAMDTEVHREITASGEEWLRTAIAVLATLPGKPNPDGTGHLLAPGNADPDMIGALVATMLRDMPPFT